MASEPEPEPELRPAKKPRRGGRRVKSAAMVSDDAVDDTFTPPPLADPEVVDPAASARQKVNSEWSEAEKGEVEHSPFQDPHLYSHFRTLSEAVRPVWL